MTPLEKLIADLIDDSVPSSSLLKQLKILASRTGSQPPAWVAFELTGYPETAKVPDFRIVKYGLVQVQMRDSYRAIELDESNLRPGSSLAGLFLHQFREGADELDRRVRRGEQAIYNLRPAGVELFNNDLQSGKIVLPPRRSPSPSPANSSPNLAESVDLVLEDRALASVRESVRQRILDVVMRIERVAPRAGQADSSKAENERANKANQTFNFYAQTNFATHSSNFQQQNMNLPRPGNSEDLIRYLEELRVPLYMIDQLRHVVRLDTAQEEVTGEKNRWRRTRDWLNAAGTDVATGALGGAITAAATTFLS